MTRRVLHLAGSAVSRFFADLSLVYAANAVEALADPTRYDFVLAYVSPDGSWRFPDSYALPDLDRAPALSLADAIAHIASSAIDVVLPQMFCVPGMTTYRSLFDALRIPVVGNAPHVMAMTADKAVARAVVAAAGVAVPPGEVLRAGERPTLPVPAVVKPVDADNSVGVTLVRDEADFADALDAAWQESPTALVETYIELGREVRCGIVVRGGELICLPLEEYAVDSSTKPVRGRDDKLTRTDDGQLVLVAKNDTRAWMVPTTDPVTERVWEAARRAHVALGCRDYSLFDFRIDPDGKPWFLEAGLYCSFARTSVIAMMAKEAGIEVGDLFADALREVRRRTLLDHSTIEGAQL